MINDKRLKNKSHSAIAPLDIEDRHKWIHNLSNKNIIKICTDYLGSNVVTFANQINHLFEDEWKHESMQPHIDSRCNDLKIYIWISDYTENCHPLYYLKGSHKKFKFWLSYDDTRNTNIEKSEMEKIYGNVGDVIIFDTNGWHSHYKEKNTPRTVLDMCIAPNNIFFGTTKKGKNILKINH